MANQLKEEIILSTQHFDQKIDDVIKKVNKLQQQGNKVGGGFNQSMSSMIQKATGFNGSMTSLIGVVGKFAGGIGLAMTATEAFNKTIHSSQTLEDEFGRIQASVTTLVDDFFSSLATGDFSPFLNGIDSLVNKAREAYDIMDDLWNMSLSFGVQNARLNNTFQKNLLEIRKLKGSKDPEDQKRMKQLIAENEKIIKKQAESGAKLYNQTIKGLQAEIAAGTGMNSKITEAAIYKILENDINDLKGGRAKFKKGFSEYEKELEKLNKKADKKQGDLFMGRTGVNYSKQRLALEKKYGVDIAANYLLQEKSDEELEEYVNKLKQGIHYQGAAISYQSKLLRYTKETTNAASGGSRGGGRGGSREESTAEKVKRQWKDAENEAYLFARELQDVQKNTLPNIDERLSNISPFDMLNAQRYQDMVKQGKGKFSFGDTGGTKTYNEEGIEVYFTINEDSVQDIYQKYDWLVGRIQEAMKNNEMGILSAEEVNSTIDYINKELEKLGLKPIKLHVETDAEKALAEAHKKLKAATSAVAELGSSISGLGQALEVPVLDVAGVMAQAIATMILGYAEASKLAGTLGPWAWISFGALGLGQLVSIITAVKSLGAYANGGIVGGSSYAGDRLYARVNSGEMILNSQQQSHLFNMINNGGGGVASTGEVQFVIRGADLYGAMKNYNSKMKKVR